ANGQLEDLSTYLKDWPITEQLTDRAVQFGSWYNDTPYMIPYGFYIRAMFWNKELFAEAGMTEPPKTTEEFVEASRKIAALGGGKTGYCLRGGPGATNGYIMFMLNELGSNEFFDAEGNSTLDKPEAVRGLQILADMYREGLVPKDSVNWGFNEIVAGFYSGTCAMLDQDPDALIAVAERMPADKFAVAPMPLGPSGKSFPTMGYAGWAMFSSSEHKDESWKLIAHLSSPEMNLEWAKVVGVIPIHKGAEKDPFFDTEQYRGWFTELNDPRWQLTAMPTYLEEFGFFADQISISAGQEMLLGQRTPEDVAREWAAYLTEAQKKWLAAR
ncbi:ABC transporter substrate-binding protein, partial [Geminicoccus flavidas]|uniref:ABC transporter substrate-binding protein n=1 Tax=Geminicoccus flavidas TaxID=2506407 RepID=UPI001356B78F